MRIAGFLALMLLLAAPAWAEPTEITVHVRGKGSKFIGSTMGGMQVTLEDAQTGELLAKGLTAGTTGDTARIMTEKRLPDSVIVTPDAAGFTTVLDLEEPRLVRVTATGPMSMLAGNEVSSTMWVMPGKHVNQGNAWMLELPGFMVDLIEPRNVTRLSAPASVAIEINLTTGCGCPIAPGGLWDSDGYEIAALIMKDGEVHARAGLESLGTANRFGTTVEVQEPGIYEIRAFAHDPKNGNTGLDRAVFIVQ